MYDDITINLRALSEEGIQKLKDLLEEDLTIIDDEDNQLALETIKNFKAEEDQNF